MLTYMTLQDRPREFLAATSLTHDEFTRLLPAFAAAYAVCYPPDKTWQGKGRQRQRGGGAKGSLPHIEKKIPFNSLLLQTKSLKNHPRLQFQASQTQNQLLNYPLPPFPQPSLTPPRLGPEA